MNLEYIEQVVELVRGAQITELTVRVGPERLTVRKSPLQLPVPAGNGERRPEGSREIAAPPPLLEVDLQEEPPAPPRTAMIKAHLVGIFYRGLGPEAEPLIDVGDGVEEGDTVGMIESMRNLMEVRSAVRGRVETVLVAEGQPVEYGQELFEVDVTAEP